MTREALTAELAALDARRAEIEQQLADMGAGLLKGIWRYPVLSAREAVAQQLARGLEGVTGAPYEVSHLMDVPQ
jgi:cell division protein FtsB